MSDITQFNYPTPIRFGAGVVSELPQQLETLGSKRPLLVTDKILAQLPIGLALRETLEQSAFESAVFSEIWGNPVISQVEQGLAAFREHQADAIVAMGGGASLDVAKIIAL
ncbi:MAG: iron-containing alcohol dehydrogenase, partial [bacterium]